MAYMNFLIFDSTPDCPAPGTCTVATKTRSATVSIQCTCVQYVLIFEPTGELIVILSYQQNNVKKGRNCFLHTRSNAHSLHGKLQCTSHVQAHSRGGGVSGGSTKPPPRQSVVHCFGPDNQLSLPLHQSYCWMTRHCSKAWRCGKIHR